MLLLGRNVSRRPVVVLVLAVVIGVHGCSSPDRPCHDIPAGTPLASLPSIGGGYPAYLVDTSTGQGLSACCATGPITPQPDGGCGPSCDPGQRVQIYELGAPYGGGSCPELAEYGDGRWICEAVTFDGGVLWTNGFCQD